MTDNRPSTKGAGTATVFGVVDVAGRNYGWFLTEDRARNAALEILRDKLVDALFVNWVDGRGEHKLLVSKFRNSLQQQKSHEHRRQQCIRQMARRRANLVCGVVAVIATLVSAVRIGDAVLTARQAVYQTQAMMSEMR
jgi:hypothetical protein